MGKTYDAIIIGAGIIGAPIAYELTKMGYKTLNVDKGPDAGEGSTAGSCAIVRAHYSTEDGVAFAYEGFKYWLDWENYLDNVEDVPSHVAGRLVERSETDLLGFRKVARKQMSDFSGMLNFTLDCELLENFRFLENLQVITHAVSLGHDQSLVFYLPTVFFFQDMVELSEEKKMKHWSQMGDGGFRFSVGIENADDLIEDLERALDSMGR